MVDAVLIFPPQWIPDHPYLSLPALSSFLLEKGFDVVQEDVNVLFYDYLLSKGGLEKYYTLIGERLNGGDGTIGKKGKFYYTIGESIIQNVESAKCNLRKGKNIINGFTLLRAALEMVSSACYPTSITFDTFLMEYSPLSVQSIKKAVFDSKQNIFLNFFEDEVIPNLLRHDPPLFAISVIHNTQLIPALTLASRLKKYEEESYVVLGGPFLSAFLDMHWRLKDVFDFADSVIAFDGETALASLIECVEKEKDFLTVPNLIFREGERIKHSSTFYRDDMNALPTPNFDGLPLKLYFSPILVLPVQTARGCYWARCAFCPNSTGKRSRYRSRDAALVAEDMDNLQSRYNTCYFELADDAVPPQKLRQLSEELLSKDMDAKWTAFTRLEKQFTPPLLSRMYEAGCRILYFGLESANPRILKLMDKGTDIETAHRILSDSHHAGIWNHVYVFFGFPTETEKEAEDTIRFVVENKDIINSVGFGYFVLCEGSRVYENKEQFRIEKIIRSEEEFSLSHQYIPLEGMDQNQAKQIARRFHKEVEKIFHSSFIYNFRWLSPLLEHYLD